MERLDVRNCIRQAYINYALGRLTIDQTLSEMQTALGTICNYRLHRSGFTVGNDRNMYSVRFNGESRNREHIDELLAELYRIGHSFHSRERRSEEQCN